MSDFPNQIVAPLFVSSFSEYTAGFEVGRITNGMSSSASITWPTANTAFYIPVWLPFPFTVRRVFWANGTTVTTVNNDFGIYTADGARIYSTGSTAQVGVSVVQYVTATEFTLYPGRYYFAMATSTNTSNKGGQGSTAVSVDRLRLAGVLQEASALPLPATMTPVSLAVSCFPLCGITSTSTGF